MIEEIWSEYRTAIKAFLHSKVANASDVDDLLQDILLKTYQNLSTLKDSKNVKSWLFQIANNTIIDFYRKRGKENNHAEEPLWYSNDDKSLYDDLSQCIAPFINALPQDMAELLTATEINGVSQKEYAEQHGISYSTLKSRVQKGRGRLLNLFSSCCDFSLDSQGRLADFEQKTVIKTTVKYFSPKFF